MAKTITQLTTEAQAILNQPTLKGNTKAIVGGLFQDIVDYLASLRDSTLKVVSYAYNASGGGYPTIGTDDSGVPHINDFYVVGTPSPPDGSGNVKFPTGAKLIANVSQPGQTDANWDIIYA